MKIRKCSKCKMEKSLRFFRKRSSTNNYYQSWCKSCEREYQKTHEESIYSRRAHNLRRKYGGYITTAELREIGPPGVCYLCGEQIVGRGEYDHIDPGFNGGVASKENIKWTHRRCNHVKFDMTIKELKVLLKKILIQISKH